ncbi:MAG: hypothetical protein JXN59_13945 [Anaerolineae bacterium]|nr:hypothetical protein [Anaerolineae bacterium]
MTTRRQRHPVLLMTLSGLELAALIGVGYCILALLGRQRCDLATCTLVYYTAFFVVSAICVLAILRWKRWGVVGLATTITTVALIDLLQGSSTMTDFMAVMILIAAASTLLRQAWPYMD